MPEEKSNAKPYLFRKKDIVMLTKMGHISEIQYMEKMNLKPHTIKLSKHEYLVLETGEVKQYIHNENRSQNANSLRKTFKKLRYLINNNFIGASNELFLTLTYAENMTDNERLYTDVDKFVKRLRYRCKNQSTVDYLNVVEPQERGAWHCHMLIRFNDLEKIFIPNAELAKLWGHGFVTVKSMKKVDNIGAYLTAYLADVELTGDNDDLAYKDDTKVVEKTVNGQEKKFIKGGRLYMYPSGMNLYRKSKGILPPERSRMHYEKAKEAIGAGNPNYFRRIDIETPEYSNVLIYEEYNTLRAKKQ